MLGLSKRNIWQNTFRILLVAALVFTMGFATVRTASAQEDGAGSGTAATSTGDEESDDGTTCAIEKVGWILCPVIEASSWIGDQAFSFLARMFLEAEPELVADESGTRDAWELARNIANLMFIIAFLVIIFSQVTGRGLNNYGIKKMLPRLIIAAIAVNVSYYICQLMVDVSNVMGYEFKNFLVDTAGQVSDRSAMPIQTSVDVQTSEGNLGTLGAIALGVLALGTVLYFLPVLISVILSIALICMVIVLILLLRKAIIVLLVVASPIAFVAYILPNTEKFFQKWLKMFWQLLLVFPVVGLLMGGGQLASAIVLAAGTTSDDNSVYKAGDDEKCIQLPSNSGTDGGAEVRPCGDGSTPFLLGLTAAGIAVAPLIAVYSVLKGALSAAGAIGGFINSNMSKARSGASRFGKGYDERRQKRIEAAAIRPDSSRLGKALNIASAGTYRRRAKRDAIDKNLDRELNMAKLDYTSRKAQDSEAFRRQMAGGSIIPGTADQGAMRRAESNATSAVDALQAEEIKASSVLLRNLDNGGLRKITEDSTRDVNDPEVAAAIQHLAERQDFRGLEHALDKFANSKGSLAARVLSQSLSQHAGELFTGGQLGDMSRGAFRGNYADTVRNNLRNGIITAEKAASMGPSMAEEVSDLAAGDQQAMQQLVNSAYAALTDPILSKKVGRQRSQLTNFSQGRNASAGKTQTSPDQAGFKAW